MALTNAVSQVRGRTTIAASQATWDIVFVVAFFAMGALLGRSALQAQARAGRLPAFYQNWLAAAIYETCGFGFVDVPVAVRTPALVNFLSLRSDSITCRDLPTDALQPAEPFALMHRYLAESLTWLWRWRGIRWSAISPLFELFSGLVSSVIYLLFRIGMNRPWSIAGTAAIATSGLNLFYLHKLRDYSKAPFLLASLLILGWLVTRPMSRRPLLTLAGLFGTVIGVGLGFRTDIILAVPLFVLTIAWLLPTPRPSWTTRVAAVLTFVATLIVTGWPVLLTYGHGSNTGHAALIGYTEQFADTLGLEHTDYLVNQIYGDRPIEWAARNYELVTEGGSAWSVLTSVRYDRQTVRLLQAVVRLLPADTLIHAYAAILRVFESPFSAPGREDCETLRPSMAGTACQARNLVLGSVPRIVGPLAAACLIVLMLAANVRIGVFLLAVVAVFIGSTTLQFDPRHTFYLEFVGLWPIGFFLQRAGAGGLSRLRPLARRAILIAVVLCAIPAIPLIAARAYQQRVLTTLFTRYLAADATSVPVTWSPSSPAVPLDHLLPPLDPFNANAVSPSPTLRSGMLRIEVGGAACAGHTSYVALRYEVPFNGQLAQQAAVLPWTVPADGSAVHLFMPIYRMQIALPGGSSPIGEVRLLGLEMMPTETACLRSLATLDRPSDFPISLMAILGPDWRTHRLYQTLSATGVHNSQTPGYP